MKKPFRITVLFFAISFAFFGKGFAQTYDLSSGGAPTITGALSGSVTGASNAQSSLSVTIDFGELSPMNTSGIVRVVVPVGIRSTGPYRVIAQVTGSINANIQAIQPADVGFGIGNLRRLGAQSLVCNNSDHIIYSPFGNDPSTNTSINANGRVIYPSSLNNITAATTILTGPRLSGNNSNRLPNNAWIFDAVFAIAPQFYAPGSSSATISFTISAGPNVPC